LETVAQRKSILITGAGSGIGRETAALFAAKGWLVGAADVNDNSVRRLAAECPANSVVPIHADVSTRAGARAMVDTFLAQTGGTLDTLFNCAGTLRMGPHENIGAAGVDLMLSVNVNGVVYCIDAAFDALKATPGAHIISMSSTSAEYGAPDLAVYSATKFFVRGLTEALNIEFARHDINVSAILVAYVQTPMVLDADVKARSVDVLGVKVTPKEVAGAVWKAAHGRRVLWRVGMDATALNIAVRILGSRSRGLYKMLTGY
jgi:NAD(P)-dependent dehydrogenase (short-subunit alcohol dehydrogenase family)